MLSFSGTNNFIDNSAGDIGGAISTYNNTVLSFSGTNNFINNSAGDIGGAISTYNNTVLSFIGTNNFINNLAHYVGGAILMLKNALLCLNGTSNFINNSASEGGAICTLDIAVLSFNGTRKFINNTAGYGGGAIFAVINSTLTVNGTIYFTNNGHYGGGVNTQNGDVYTAYGGGVYIGPKSTFSILPNTTVYWENNHATLGGAIYVYDDNPRSDCAFFASYTTIVPNEECFFQLPGQNLSDGIDVRLVFKNNSAGDAGSVLFGGAIDNCKLTGLDSYNSGEVFDKIVHNNGTIYNTTSNVSSEPIQICPCEHNQLNCSETQYCYPRTVYPGEIFQVSVVAVGQRDGAVPSTVISTTWKDPNFLGAQYSLQQTNNTCSTLSYAVSPLSQRVFIFLQADHSPCNHGAGIL